MFRSKVEESWIEDPKKNIKIYSCGINVRKGLTAGVPSDVQVES